MLAILTGCGCCGKTTLAEALRNKNHYVVPEAASKVIINRKKAGRYLPWEVEKNFYCWMGFEKEIFDTQLNQFLESIPPQPNIILDRGLEDILAYIELNEYEKPRWWVPTKHFFNEHDIHTFILHPIPMDNNQIRNVEYQQEVETNLMKQVYRKYYGDNVHVERRVETIEKRIEWVEHYMFGVK